MGLDIKRHFDFTFNMLTNFVMIKACETRTRTRFYRGLLYTEISKRCRRLRSCKWECKGKGKGRLDCRECCVGDLCNAGQGVTAVPPRPTLPPVGKSNTIDIAILTTEWLSYSVCLCVWGGGVGEFCMLVDLCTLYLKFGPC